MKRILALILALVMALSLAACGGDKDNTVAGGNTDPTNNTTETINNPTEGTQGSTEGTTPSATEPPATEPPATEPPVTEPPATTPPATNPPSTTPPATNPPVTTPSATEPHATNPPATTPPATNVTPEFKNAMDSYEKFFDEYVDFMNSYAKSGNPIAMLNDYLDFMQQYTETMQKMSEIKTDELSAADYAYYIEVNGRITKKLLEVGNSENNTQNGSSANQGGTSQESTTGSRNEQAVKAAEEITDTYACVDPKMIENMLVEDYGFTYTQAHYGVTHADIDWNLYAESRLTQYILMNGEDGAIGVPQVDIELYMESECGFSDEAIKYAFENAPIRKDEEGNYHYNF